MNLPPSSILVLCIVSAAVPLLFYVYFFWWLDRYEREPLWLVGLTFLWGAVGGVLIAIYGSQAVIKALATELPVKNLGLAAVMVVAPVVEEPAKAVVLAALLCTRKFDNMTDGIVYGAAVGLGFAMTENFLYFLVGYAKGGVHGLLTYIVIRTLFSAVLHTCASATFGACVGYFRHWKWYMQWLVAPLIGFLLAAWMHGAFNGLAMYGQMTQSPVLKLAAAGLVPVLATILLTVTFLSLRQEHRILVAELKEEADAGRMPAEHAAVIPFARKRKKKGWLPQGVDRKRYVLAATLLAFRKHQVRILGDRASTRFKDDIEKYRGEIRRMLAAASA